MAKRKHWKDKVRAAIYKHGHRTCGICGQPIRLGLSTNNPRSLTLDHIKPLAAGGYDKQDNLQPAHRICNEKKGAAWQ